MQSTHTLPKYQAGYPKIASELSGQSIELDKWNKNSAQRNLLLEQSHRIADKLEEEGFLAYDDNVDLTLIGLNTRQYKKLPQFRNIAFIPVVAQKQRGETIRSLQYFLQSHPNCRMWTITTGTRCNELDVVDRCQDMHRKVSKINDRQFMKRAGARFVFRSTEFGEVVETNNELSLHPHCHAVLMLSKFLPKREWSELIARIRGHFGAHCQDNGKIREPREFVKYCVKPSDLETLSGKSLVCLAKITSSMRMVETLRDLRVLRKDIRESNHKLVRKRGILKRVSNWNSAPKIKDTLTEEQMDEVTYREQMSTAMKLTNVDCDPVASPFVVAWCAPAPVFAPVTEPLFLVHGLQGADPSKCFAWQDVQNMRESINVHTKALTVHRRERENGEKVENIYESKQKILHDPPVAC